MTRAHWFEVVGLTVTAAVLAAAVVFSAGQWAWSWDALNHQIYLGMIAESPRWNLDVLAASVQGYQYPYLYWPIYRLTTLPIDGVQAGAIWAAFQSAMILPPVWLASWHLLPAQGSTAQATFERVAACALAGSSIVVLAGVGTTANDPMAALPLLWAVALMTAPRTSDRRAAVAAGLWGVSTAFKWSNGLALPILLFWWWQHSSPHLAWKRGFGMAVAGTLGFAAAYLPWGLQLWQVTGNPFHPRFAAWFGG